MDPQLELRMVEAAERQANALEAIAGELRQLREEPLYAPMGLAVVDKNSPQGQRAQLLARMQLGGFATPGPPHSGGGKPV